jgi:hypothetical protein
MQVPRDSRRQLSGLDVMIAHYDQGLSYRAVRQVGPDAYILADPPRLMTNWDNFGGGTAEPAEVERPKSAAQALWPHLK